MIRRDRSGERTGTIRRPLILTVAGLALLFTSLYAGQNEGPFPQWIWTVILGALVSGFLVLWAAYGWGARAPGARWVLLVVLAGLAFRIAVMPASRELSDDVARYHWDGKVLSHGINPYLHAPDDPEVAALRTDAIDERINHPWYRTCYPPFAQFLFAGAYLLTPGSLVGFQMLCLLAELVTWILLFRQLKRRQQSVAWLLLAAWNPLLITQGYLSGHLDLLALPFVTLFILQTAAGRPWHAGVALGLACLIKPLPLIFVPAALGVFRWRGGWRFLAAVAVVTAALYAPFLEAGGRLFASTWLMATQWSFNGSLGAALESILPIRAAHLVAAILLASAILIGARRGRDLLARMLLAQAAFIVFTPTLFPWYLTGMFPLLVLRRDPALLLVAVLAPLVDEVVIQYHNTGIWQSAAWVQYAEYVPFFVLLLLGAWRGWGMFARAGVSRKGAEAASVSA